MAQIFPQWFNRAPLIGLIVAAGTLFTLTVAVAWTFSPRFTDVGYQPQQPVPFSHRLHAGELEIDCRYCHFGVEVGAVAGVPPTATCLKCHELVRGDALAAVHASWETGEPLRWVRVHNVPDYATFPHAPHLRVGVGCQSCHGDVAAMDEIRQVEPLSMRWCLECHRHPFPHLRPRSEVTNTSWVRPADPRETPARLEEVEPPTDCSACHR